MAQICFALTNLFAALDQVTKTRSFLLTHQRKQINFNALQLRPFNRHQKKMQKKEGSILTAVGK